MKVICDKCGKTFNMKPSEYKKNEHHYCSYECHREVMRETYINNFNSRVGYKYILIEYKDKDNVTVECKVCGGKFTRTSSLILRVNCPVCKEQRAKLKALNNSITKATLNTVKENRKQLNDLSKRIYKAIEKKKKQAIAEEQRKERRREANKLRELKREGRIKNNGRVDKDITLEKLFARDKGICSLCGTECNYTDCKTDDRGYFITGNTYPSIDHIMPLSKGGTHTWDNVQLAHFYCNSKKRNNTRPI